MRYDIDDEGYSPSLKVKELVVCDQASKLSFPEDFEAGQLAKRAPPPPPAGASMRPYAPRPRLTMFDGAEDVQLRSIELLGGRFGSVGEVWACEAVQDQATDDRLPTRVCLKLFQQKHCPLPEWATERCKNGEAPSHVHDWTPVASYVVLRVC